MRGQKIPSTGLKNRAREKGTSQLLFFGGKGDFKNRFLLVRLPETEGGRAHSQLIYRSRPKQRTREVRLRA